MRQDVLGQDGENVNSWVLPGDRTIPRGWKAISLESQAESWYAFGQAKNSLQGLECMCGMCGGGVAGWRRRPREARGDGGLGHCRVMFDRP